MTKLKTQLLSWVFPELNLGILELIEDLFYKHCLEALCRVSKPEQLYICDWFQKGELGGKGEMKELGQVLQLLLINLAKQQMGNQQTSTFQQKFKVEVIIGRLDWQVLASWEGIARKAQAATELKAKGLTSFLLPSPLSFPLHKSSYFILSVRNWLLGFIHFQRWKGAGTGSIK